MAIYLQSVDKTWLSWPWRGTFRTTCSSTRSAATAPTCWSWTSRGPRSSPTSGWFVSSTPTPSRSSSSAGTGRRPSASRSEAWEHFPTRISTSRFLTSRSRSRGELRVPAGKFAVYRCPEMGPCYHISHCLDFVLQVSTSLDLPFCILRIFIFGHLLRIKTVIYYLWYESIAIYSVWCS